jgi:hypothetical protein
MGGAGGSYWAICWLFYVQVLFIRHSSPRLYPLTKSVGLQTSSMSCPLTYDAHKNIRWRKTRWCVLGRCGFRRPCVICIYAGSLRLRLHGGVLWGLWSDELQAPWDMELQGHEGPIIHEVAPTSKPVSFFDLSAYGCGLCKEWLPGCRVPFALVLMACNSVPPPGGEQAAAPRARFSRAIQLGLTRPPRSVQLTG